MKTEDPWEQRSEERGHLRRDVIDALDTDQMRGLLSYFCGYEPGAFDAGVAYIVFGAAASIDRKLAALEETSR